MLKKLSSYFFLSVGIITSWPNVHASKYDYEIQGPEHSFTDSDLNRDKIIMASYVPKTTEDCNGSSVLFLHGGPGLKNEGQFDKFFSKFTQKGYAVYTPEIIGSSAYETEAQDANEYTKNYQKDIHAVLKHISGKTTGRIYGIAHSLGCHQLLRSLTDSSFENKITAVTAIAGPSDLGANRLYALQKAGRSFDEKTFLALSKRSLLGYYSPLNGQEGFTIKYNPVVSEDLNKQFSVLYHAAAFPDHLPVQLIHAKDDKQVCFSLSIDLYKELKNQGKKVSGYFLTAGDHGFIKNPLELEMPDTNSSIRDNVATHIMNFFESEELKISLDGIPVNIENISMEDDARKIHQDYLQSIKVSK